MAVASDGSIVVAGHNTSDYYSIILARYTDNGTLDDTFDGDSAGNGKIAIDPDSNPTNTYGSGGSDDIHIALDGEDRIILCGTVSDSFSDAFIIRLTTAGILDASFDGEEVMDSYPGNGYLRIDIGSSSDYFHALAVDSEGRIVVAGEYDNGTYMKPMALRLWP